MPSPTDIVSSLPILRWDGLDAPPYDLITGAWENRLAARSVPYTDGEGHDATGRSSFPMKARLYFCNGLDWSQEGVDNLYPQYWEKWRPSLLSGKAKDLEHPVLGPMRARVKGGQFELKATIRSGIIVDVDWIETVEDFSVLNLNGYPTTSLPTAGLAADADDAVEEWGVGFAPDRPFTSLSVQYGLTEEPVTLESVFTAIRPSIFAASSAAISLLASFASDVAAMVDALDLLGDVRTWVARDALVRFWCALDDARRQVNRTARARGVYVVPSPMGLDAVGRKVGNTTTELMGLNFGLLSRPGLERGTPVNYYLKG